MINIFNVGVLFLFTQTQQMTNKNIDGKENCQGRNYPSICHPKVILCKGAKILLTLFLPWPLPERFLLGCT